MASSQRGDLSALSIAAALKRSAETGKDEWLPDGTGRGSGRLLLRATAGGGFWYFRYSTPDGRRDTLPLGPYAKVQRSKDENTGRAYSLGDARERYRELGALLKDPRSADVRAHLHAEERAASASRELAREAERAADAEKQSKALSLGKLCLVYCDYLSKRGRISAQKVRADLTRHVLTHPLADKTARDVSRAEVAGLIRAIVDLGKRRTAGLVRSYVSAAYTLAMDAEGNIEAPASLLDFRINSNPVAGIKAIPVAARSRVLSPYELGSFLRRLDTHADIVADALWVCLLGGGQRPAQMLRAQISDYDVEEGVLSLLDGKGRRQSARLHVLPLGPAAKKRMARCAERAASLETPWLFSSAGEVPVDLGTASWRVTTISREMVDAEESSVQFQMKDLRRTVETMLAAQKVSKDLRAQLLSHGLGGVQDRHYDRHAYTDEKRRALKNWEARLLALHAGKSI